MTDIAILANINAIPIYFHTDGAGSLNIRYPDIAVITVEKFAITVVYDHGPIFIALEFTIPCAIVAIPNNNPRTIVNAESAKLNFSTAHIIRQTKAQTTAFFR